MSAPLRIAVVGGGISGLAAAHRIGELARERSQAVRVMLLEEQERLGGAVRTLREGDLLLEAGPDQLVTHKPAGIELCERVGLAGEVIELRGERLAPRVLHGGRPVDLPADLSTFVPRRLTALLRAELLSWRGAARVGLERFVPPRKTDGDESLAAFVSRRFGREFYERVAEPIFGGIFTADAERMSMEMALPRLLALERLHGSVTRGVLRSRKDRAAPAAARRAGLVSLRAGWSSLVERLAARLADAEVRRSTRVQRIEPRPEGRGYRIWLEHAPPAEVDRVILACPAFVSAGLLAWDPALSQRLGRLAYAGCTTVYLLYPAGACTTPLAGSGYFVPRSSGEAVLACSYVSNKFPDRVPHAAILLRVFLGGARHPEIDGLEDEAVARLARTHAAAVLGLSAPPRLELVFHHPRSMPQFDVGHRARLEQTLCSIGRHPGLTVCGAAAGATGLPDCIASAERAAEAALEPLGAAESAPDVGRGQVAVSPV